MDTYCHVIGRLVDGVVTAIVERFDSVETKGGAKWFVEQLDGSDDVGITFVTLCEAVDGIKSLGDSVALLPIDGAIAAGVVKSVLGSRRTVKVEEDLETSASGPADCLI